MAIIIPTMAMATATVMAAVMEKVKMMMTMKALRAETLKNGPLRRHQGRTSPLSLVQRPRQKNNSQDMPFMARMVSRFRQEPPLIQKHHSQS
jgi:hypothetical protein